MIDTKNIPHNDEDEEEEDEPIAVSPIANSSESDIMHPKAPKGTTFNKKVVLLVAAAVALIGGLSLISAMNMKPKTAEKVDPKETATEDSTNAIPSSIKELADTYQPKSDGIQTQQQLNNQYSADYPVTPEVPNVSQNPFLTTGTSYNDYSGGGSSYQVKTPRISSYDSYGGGGGDIVSSRVREAEEAKSSSIRFGGQTGAGVTPDTSSITSVNNTDVARSAQSSSFYSSASIEPARSKYEVKAGSIIPAILITGINSDLPGNIVAQVRENVYDSTNGRYLLIPQGAKLVGTYDSKTVYSQSRILVVWTRMIFPNGASLDLGNMAGVDLAGNAGLKDKVNNHLKKLIGGAVITSLLSAGASSSSRGSDTNSFKDAMGSALGENIANTGNQYVQKNLNVSPTIEIRPGTKFNLMVDKDFILKPYK